MTAGRGILRVGRGRGFRRRGLVAMTDAAIGVTAMAGALTALWLAAGDGGERVRDERLAAAVSVAGEAAMARVREADGEALSGRFALSGAAAPSGYRLAGCVMGAPDGSRIVMAGLEGRDGAPPPALPPMSDSLFSQPLGTALGQVTADGVRLEGRGWSIDAAPLRAKCGFPRAGSIAFTARITRGGSGWFLWRTNAPYDALNRMRVDLDMGGGDVTGALSIAADRADVDETLHVGGIATVGGALAVGGDADFKGGIAVNRALDAGEAAIAGMVKAGMVDAASVRAGVLHAGRVRADKRVSAKEARVEDLWTSKCEGCGS